MKHNFDHIFIKFSNPSKSMGTLGPIPTLSFRFVATLVKLLAKIMPNTKFDKYSSKFCIKNTPAIIMPRIAGIFGSYILQEMKAQIVKESASVIFNFWHSL